MMIFLMQQTEVVEYGCKNMDFKLITLSRSLMASFYLPRDVRIFCKVLISKCQDDTCDTLAQCFLHFISEKTAPV